MVVCSGRSDGLQKVFAIFLLCLVGSLTGCGKEQSSGGKGGAEDKVTVVHFGHFPNVTHAQGMIAHYLSSEGKGWFEERLGPGVRIDWYVYNAGPSAMEGFFTGALDVTYVGPNPALNAYIRSRGKEVRVLAGAAKGGAGLVVRKDGGIEKPEDFRGKRIATPQFGNTQDVSCRAWLAAKGFRVTRTGGDVSVIPTSNPDQLPLFVRGDLDGAWTVEPWVSRLEMEAGGRLFLMEEEALTTVLAARAGFLSEHRDLARRIVQAHRELTDWIVAHPDEAQKMVTAELSRLTRSEASAQLIAHAWPRIRFTGDIEVEGFRKFLDAARGVGFLQDASTDLDGLVEKP